MAQTYQEPRRRNAFWYDAVFGPAGAATIAGSCEIVMFHPFDTAAKRLMSHRHRVVDPHSLRMTCTNLYNVVFAGLHQGQPGVNATRVMWTQRVMHLYPGSTYAVAYKVLQRIVKFAGQPYVKDYLQSYHGQYFRNKVDSQGRSLKHGKGSLLLETTAGGAVGVMEISLLPFDRMKVLSQTNKTALQKRGMARVIWTEGIASLYAGAMTTMVRNITGTSILFGGTALVKEYVFKLSDYKDATFAQNLMASTIGSCLGVFCTSPMDVIKTRIQGAKFGERVSGWRLFLHTMQSEGISAFYKGITPKIITSAPRLVFSYTMTLYFTKLLRGEANKGQKVKHA